jgi:alkanesulfonate monooxygenase SsuD/methylene tetrahydromethanopterin reductase-like flavin-dependent oxidoreductase (luciferase family)
MPSPNLMLAAIAARTKRMRLGVMGNVLPFHQPWKLVEELHVLDYLTQGRLEIGAASGVPPEFTFIDIDQADVRPMFAEILDVIDAAADNKWVSYTGKHFKLDEVHIMPPRRKEARRRNWMTIYSEASCRMAARRGYKVCAGYQSADAVRSVFAGYLDEADKCGIKVGPDDLGIRRQVLIWDTNAEAAAINKELQESAQIRMQHMFEPVMQRIERAGVAQADSVRQSGVIDAAAVTRGDKPSSGAVSSLQISPDEYFIGSPTAVAEQIIEHCRKIGVGNFMAYHAHTMAEDQIRRNYTLWEQVIPIVQKAGLVGKAA